MANPKTNGPNFIRIKAMNSLLSRCEDPLTSLKWKKHPVKVEEEVNDFKIGVRTSPTNGEKISPSFRNILAVSTDGSFKEFST